MPRLSQIIDPFASVLGVPARTMNVIAAVLRKNGMITKAGRGPGGAQMQNTDCTNLLLAAMSNGESTGAHENVATLRAMEPERYHNSGTPDVNFLRENLGATLDALFSDLIEKGDTHNSKTGAPIEEIDFALHGISGAITMADFLINDGSDDNLSGDKTKYKSAGFTHIRTHASGNTSSTGIRHFSSVDLETLDALAEIIKSGREDET